jgi:hypothetical protein
MRFLYVAQNDYRSEYRCNFIALLNLIEFTDKDFELITEKIKVQ